MRCYPALQRALIVIVLLLGALSGDACRSQGSSGLDTPDLALDACNLDSDCVLAIRVDVCCPCPEITTQVRARETKGVEIYTPGRDYGPLLPADCAHVACAPCPPLPAGVECSAGQCRAPETGP